MRWFVYSQKRSKFDPIWHSFVPTKIVRTKLTRREPLADLLFRIRPFLFTASGYVNHHRSTNARSFNRLDLLAGEREDEILKLLHIFREFDFAGLTGGNVY